MLKEVRTLFSYLNWHQYAAFQVLAMNAFPEGVVKVTFLSDAH